MTLAPCRRIRSVLARPSTRSVGTNRNTLSSGCPSDDAVLPCDTRSTPRASASALIAATYELDCGPMTIRAPRSANRVSAGCACSASRFVFSTSSTTLSCLPWAAFHRCVAISSAALLVFPSVAPSPVSESNAPMWTSRGWVCADAVGAPAPSTPTTRTSAAVPITIRVRMSFTRARLPVARSHSPVCKRKAAIYCLLQQRRNDVDGDGENDSPEEVREEGMPEHGAADLGPLDIRVGDLERHPDAERDVREVHIARCVVAFRLEVDTADRSRVVLVRVPQRVDGVDDRPRQDHREHRGQDVADLVAAADVAGLDEVERNADQARDTGAE